MDLDNHEDFRTHQEEEQNKENNGDQTKAPVLKFVDIEMDECEKTPSPQTADAAVDF